MAREFVMMVNYFNQLLKPDLHVFYNKQAAAFVISEVFFSLKAAGETVLDCYLVHALKDGSASDAKMICGVTCLCGNIRLMQFAAFASLWPFKQTTEFLTPFDSSHLVIFCYYFVSSHSHTLTYWFVWLQQVNH